MLSGLKTRLFGAAEIKNSTPLTRFESQIEFKQIINLMKQLRDKESALKKESEAEEKGVSSIEYRKYFIIQTLLSQLDQKIRSYNNKNTNGITVEHKNETDINKKINTVEMTQLAQELAIITRDIYSANTAVINEVRHAGIVKTMDVAVDIIAIGTTVAATSVVSLNMAPAAGFFFGPSLSRRAKEYCGLDKPKTTTGILMISLLNTLEKMVESLNLVLQYSKSKQQQEEVEEEIDQFVCPITRDLMRDPVVCKLDGISYEREALVRWLTEKRSSPMRGAQIKMKPNQVVDDVISDNIYLRQLIEKHKLNAIKESKSENMSPAPR